MSKFNETGAHLAMMASAAQRGTDAIRDTLAETQRMPVAERRQAAQQGAWMHQVSPRERRKPSAVGERQRIGEITPMQQAYIDFLNAGAGVQS